MMGWIGQGDLDAPEGVEVGRGSWERALEHQPRNLFGAGGGGEGAVVPGSRGARGIRAGHICSLYTVAAYSTLYKPPDLTCPQRGNRTFSFGPAPKPRMFKKG